MDICDWFLTKEISYQRAGGIRNARTHVSHLATVSALSTRLRLDNRRGKQWLATLLGNFLILSVYATFLVPLELGNLTLETGKRGKQEVAKL